MTSQKRPSRAKMLTAIASTGGVISRISAKLNYSWHATKAAIDADEVVKQAYLDECERVDDLAESTIIASFARPDNPDTDNARWWLKSRRRAKFGDAIQHTGADGGPIEVNYKDAILRKLLTSEDDTPADNG
jgi:hypothetical protein